MTGNGIRAAIDVAFWRNVERRGQHWIWTGKVLRSPWAIQLVFPCAHLRTSAARRVAWYLIRGEDPGDSYVCRTCDEPLCVRHLIRGDSPMSARPGRRHSRVKAKNPGHLGRHGHHVHGERHPKARLTVSKVREIRRRAPTATYCQLAREHGVTPPAIRKIVLRLSWAHVP